MSITIFHSVKCLATLLLSSMAGMAGFAANAADLQAPKGCDIVSHSALAKQMAKKPSSSFPPIQLELRTPLAPTVLSSAGLNYLIYELHMRNFSEETLNLRSIEVINADNDAEQAFVEYKDEQLKQRLRQVGVDKQDKRLHLNAGQSAIAYLCLAFDDKDPVPNKLRHRIVLDGVVADGSMIETHATKLHVLGRPLTGSNWTAANGPSLDSHHRMGLLVVGGLAQNSRRYAFDWKKYQNGLSYAGDALDVHSYFAYAQSVLAVADGTVMLARDGMPNNIPRTAAGFTTAVPITMDSIAGNFVVIDIGDGQFAQYFHLEPGSVRVKIGDRVQRGQALARVGNSGDAREPHLHFQISTTTDVFASEGLPFVFDHYRLNVQGTEWQNRTNEYPMGKGVIDFGSDNGEAQK